MKKILERIFDCFYIYRTFKRNSMYLFHQVTDKLQALNDEFAAMTKKKKDLEDNIELCSQKLDRAEKLILGLGGERDRWSEMAVNLGSKLTNITGDVLMASGMVAYLGAFDVVYRKAIIHEWQVT